MQPFYFKSLAHPYSEEANLFQSRIQCNSYAAVKLFCTMQKQIL